MKVIDRTILNEGKVKESILIHSFDEYKVKGGKMDMLDAYAKFKERAKEYESHYISLMDQALSGIEVPVAVIRGYKLLAQVFWTLLSEWFNRPLRTVSYRTFTLEEFNKL